jgi:hypothetical protein
VFADEDADALVGDDSSAFAFESERDLGNGASGASPPHAARVRISSNATVGRAGRFAALNPGADPYGRRGPEGKFVNGIIIARSSFAETQRDVARLRSAHIDIGAEDRRMSLEIARLDTMPALRQFNRSRGRTCADLHSIDIHIAEGTHANAHERFTRSADGGLPTC